MGLVVNNLYVAGQVGKLEKEILAALSTAADRVRSRQANAAMDRWFGDRTPPTVTHVLTALTRMRTILNCESIQLGFTSIQKKAKNGGGFELKREGSNAAAVRSTSGLRPINSTLPSYAGAGFHQSNMWLDEGFARLPTYLRAPGNRIDASGWIQSKFNTLVHELSHLLLGTVDCVDGNNDTMYGTQRAESLATFGLQYVAGYDPPFAALYNAENWGIFVEAAGKNKGV